MDGNCANGGLAALWQGQVVFARPNEWFLCADDDALYYSDRDDGNRLYKKGGEDEKGKPIVKKACAFAALRGESLYYVNEEDRKVYRCSKDGRGTVACSDKKTYGYAVFDDGTVYANPDASGLFGAGNKAIFADMGDESGICALTIFDSENGKTEAFTDIRPSYINAHMGDIYYTDRQRQNKIYRLGPSGSRMSVYGASAECLHVFGDWLYFLSGKSWKRLSLTAFGEAEDV